MLVLGEALVITLASKVFTSLEQVGSQPFSAPYSVGRSKHGPESHLPPHAGNLQLRISVSNHCSGRTGNSCRRQPASRDSGWDYSDQKYHRQWTFQSVLLSPWKCLYWFSGWFMLHSRKTNCPSYTYKCIRVVLMFWLNRAVSLPMLPCLVPLGVEWGFPRISKKWVLLLLSY